MNSTPLPAAAIKTLPVKVGHRWLLGKKSINLYELYAVWLADYRTQAKYPKARPSDVTPEMVAEYLADKKAKQGIFEVREGGWTERIEL
jgi:hypothetical protein